MQRMFALSVRHNDLLIPARGLEVMLAQHSTCLAVLSGVEEYPVYLPGSATLLKYRERYFLVCTRHQLRQVTDFSSVCLMIPSERETRCITSAGAIWWPHDRNEGDHNDIAVFDFTEPCLEIPELRSKFFVFREQHPNRAASNVVSVITYGYPVAGRNCDFASGSIALGHHAILCRYAGGGSDEAIHVVDPLQPISFDPDGMSGGPAFCVLDDESSFSLHFADVNVRASRTRIMLIKAGAVQMMLNASIRGHEG